MRMPLPVVIALVGALVVALAGCGWDDVEPRWVEVEPEPMLLTSCAEDVTASVTETADEVRIDDITGDPIEGDCLGSFRLTLEAPIGDRTIVVDGEAWQRLQSSNCPDVAFFAPADVELSPGCFPQP